MTENAKNYWEAYLDASARTVPNDLPWLVYHTEERAVDSVW